MLTIASLQYLLFTIKQTVPDEKCAMYHKNT